MTEKWRSDRAAEKRKKFRVWSEEGGNRDEDIKEMEAKFPYGFGLVDKELRGLEEGGSEDEDEDDDDRRRDSVERQRFYEDSCCHWLTMSATENWGLNC